MEEGNSIVNNVARATVAAPDGNSTPDACKASVSCLESGNVHNYIRPDCQNFGAGINVYQKWKMLTEFKVFLRQYDGLYDLFEGSCFGHLLEFDSKAYFAAQIVHALLAREVTISGSTKPSEMWFKLGQHVCRFGQREFCLVTGLRFVGGEGVNIGALQHAHNGILDRYFGGGEVSVARLSTRFMEGGFHSTDDAYKVALVTFAGCVVLGLNPQVRVDSWLFNLVEDVHQFNDFPWGKYCFEMTHYYAQLGPRAPSLGNDTSRYHLYGFAWALQVWAFEAIPVIASLFAKSRLQPTGRPRFAHWTFPKKNTVISDIFTDNMEALETLEPTEEELREHYWVGVDTPVSSGTIHFRAPEHLIQKEKLTRSKKRKSSSLVKGGPGSKKSSQVTSIGASQLSQMSLDTMPSQVVETTPSQSAPSQVPEMVPSVATAPAPHLGDSQVPSISAPSSTQLPLCKKKKKTNNRKEKKKKKKRCSISKIRQVIQEEVQPMIESLYQRLTSYIDQRLGASSPLSHPPSPALPPPQLAAAPFPSPSPQTRSIRRAPSLNRAPTLRRTPRVTRH
ncbi:hypothetical protein DITRI_Ditri06bG0156000 [Diplodiscus trichospermus]